MQIVSIARAQNTRTSLIQIINAIILYQMANSILFAVIDSSSIPLNTLFAYIMFSIWRTHYVNSFAVSGVVHVVTCNNKIQQRIEC